MEEDTIVKNESKEVFEKAELDETCEDKAKTTDSKIQNLVLAESSEECHLLSSNASCHSERILRSKDISNLFRCGSFMPKSGAKAYKSPNFNYTAFFSPQVIFEAMKVRSNTQEKSANLEYLQLRQTYVEWIFELTEKLKISDNTSHLAVLLMDLLYLKDNLQNGKLQLFAPTCLLLAAKTIELDERIPFISKLRRVANPTFSVDDYKKAEITLLENVDWNPQYTSALEFLEFFLSQGSVYSSDSVTQEEEDHSDVLREKIQFQNRISEESTPSANKENLEKVWTPKSLSEVQQGETPKTTGPTDSNKTSLPDNDENTFDLSEQTSNPQTKSQQIDAENLNEGGKTANNLNRRQSLLKITTTTKISLLRDQEILKITSKIEKDTSRLSYLIARESEFVQFAPIIIACSSLAFLRKLQKLEPVWNPELVELTKVKPEQISHCLELIESKIYFERSISDFDNRRNSENVPVSTPLLESNTNEGPCQELKLFNKANSVSKQTLMSCENNDNTKQINLFSNSNSTRLASDPPTSLSKDYSVPSRIEPSKYERSRYSTSRPLHSHNYPVSTSQSQGYNRQNYHHYPTSYYPSQHHSYYNNSSYADRDYRSRNTAGSYQTESYSYKPSGRVSGSSYLRYDSTSTGTGYQPTSSYLPNSNIGTTSTANATNDNQYSTYLRNTDLFAGRNRGSGVLSARLNTSVDSGLSLQSRLGFSKKQY